MSKNVYTTYIKLLASPMALVDSSINELIAICATKRCDGVLVHNGKEYTVRWKDIKNTVELSKRM